VTKINLSKDDSCSRAKARKIMKEIYPDLTSKQIVHHRDGNPLNNNIDNLQIVNSQKEHLALHKSGNIPKRKSIGCMQISVPGKTYELLLKESDKEKLRPATLAVSILRKALEGEGE